MKTLQNNKKIIFLSLIIILLLSIFYQLDKNKNNHNHNDNFRSKINNSNNKQPLNIKVKVNYVKCGHLKLQDTLKTVFNKYGIDRINEESNDWNLYIPCGYNYAETELNNLKITKPNQFIYAIKGCDKIASKNELWKILRDYYGRNNAAKLIPESFIINDPDDIKTFKNRYNENDLYLLKKNIQRKEGILILNDYQKIMNIVKKTKRDIYNYYNNKNNNMLSYKLNNTLINPQPINQQLNSNLNNNKHNNKLNNKYNKIVNTEEDYTKTQSINSLINNYKIIQRYVSDLYIIKNRKCNLRLYLLITCHNNNKNGFLYKYGKCIYTNKDYNMNNDKDNNSNNKQVFNKEEHLTSYLLDQNIYETHPETLNDLSYFLGKKHYRMLWENIEALFKNVFLAIKPKICNKKSLQQATTFQLFGADIVFTRSLHPYLLELNKGPSMKYMNDTDKKMKIKLTEDVFKKVNIIPTSKNDIEEFITL
jgi:hypothetical protein